MSNVWRILNIHTLTTNAGFGLEYYLLKKINEAKPLLEKGIEFCKMIECGNSAMIQKTISSEDELNAYEDIQILVNVKTDDELKSIVENANLVKLKLTKMIETNDSFSEKNIRKMQDFFIDAGNPYLSRAYNIVRRKEQCRKF